MRAALGIDLLQSLAGRLAKDLVSPLVVTDFGENRNRVFGSRTDAAQSPGSRLGNAFMEMGEAPTILGILQCLNERRNGDFGFRANLMQGHGRLQADQRDSIFERFTQCRHSGLAF